MRLCRDLPYFFAPAQGGPDGGGHLPRSLADAIYRHAGLSQSVFEVWQETDGDTREGKYLRWLVQRDFNRRLTSDATTVTIGVTPL